MQEIAALLGRNVRTAREALGMSREQLAVRTRLSLSTIYRIETGKHYPQPATLRSVARVLKTTVGALTDREEAAA